MPTAVGPNTLGESNLVFAIDTHDTSNGITPLGCGGFVGSTQGVKNILTGTTYSFVNGMKLSGRTYYTAFAIDYPEGSYGGDGAGRQGITPGYDVRSGGKLYDASRALHLWVFNNDTNSWIDNGATTYFRGARLAGHCYDNYSGAETGYLYEIGLFISDYNTLKSTFPNCTFIVAGSHRADQYTAALRTILYDLGMPTGYIDSDYIAAPEWILVGKPGLGTGNAFGWVYQNYTTNAAQVAHINFGLPVKARGGMEFDGTNDYINLGASSNWAFGGNGTIEVMLKPSNSTGNDRIWCVNNNTTSLDAYLDGTTYNIYMHGGGVGTTTPVTQNVWNHVVVTYSGGTIQIYINGTPGTMAGTTTGYNISNSGTMYLGSYTDLGYNLYGEISVFKTYNKALTAQEVRQNYQQYKTRFNLS
jgi:hypothetical protein